MNGETHNIDTHELTSPETQGFHNIQPETGITVSEANKYWNTMFCGSSESAEQPQREYFDDNGTKYRDGNDLLPDMTFEINGYEYQTDDRGRVISVEGQLQVKNHEGRKEMPDDRKVVARGEMADSDDRGHLIADRFNGSGELENLVPMDGKLNRGDYLKLEDRLADAVNEGADVRMKVEPVYETDSVRPTELVISYSIDGEKDMVVFRNGSVD